MSQDGKGHQPGHKTNADVASVPIFPKGDPFAPFDPAAYLAKSPAASQSNPTESVDDRWRELGRRIPDLKRGVAESVLAKAVESDELPASPVPMARSESSSESLKVVRLLRQRKIRKRQWFAGFLGLAIVFLIFAVVRFSMNRLDLSRIHELAEKKPLDAKRLSSERVAADTRPKSISSSSSEPQFKLPSISKEEAEDPLFLGVGNESLPGQTKVESDASKDEPSAGPEPMATMAAKTDAQLDADTKAASIESPMDSPSELRSWVASMKSAREALEESNFRIFHQQMELAAAMPMTEEMKAKRARLDQLGQLYEIFIKALADAKNKIKAGEAIRLGKSKINVVEINDTNLIVRIQGKKESYRWENLPAGIADALADLTLSSEDPKDIAARAVYASISPTRNDFSVKKAEEWFRNSIGKNEIREDLRQALTDTYE
jgi:hypothetical protein